MDLDSGGCEKHENSFTASTRSVNNNILRRVDDRRSSRLVSNNIFGFVPWYFFESPIQ